MRLGVVLEAFADRTLEEALELLAATAPQISALEVGVGGFGPTPHCDVPLLLRDEAARRDWLRRGNQRWVFRPPPHSASQSCGSRSGGWQPPVYHCSNTPPILGTAP